MPLASLPTLARLDVMTADLAALRAAVRAPDAIMAVPGGAVLSLSYWRAGEEAKKTVLDVVLEEDRDPRAIAALTNEEKAGFRITVFRLPEEGRRRLDMARAEALALKVSEQAKGSRAQGSLSVSVKGCARGALPSGPLLLSTYLRADPGGPFVPLVQNLDLRSLATQAAPTQAAPTAALEPCPQ